MHNEHETLVCGRNERRLIIIDKKPSPSGTDHQFFDGSPSGLVIPLGAGDPRTQELAQRIVEAHNADVLTDLRAAMIEHDKDMARLDRNTYRAAPAASDASCVHCDGPITEGILRGTWVHTNTGLTSCRKPGELSREIFHAAPPERTPVAGEQAQCVKDAIIDKAIGCRNCGDTWERTVSADGIVAPCEDCGDVSYDLTASTDKQRAPEIQRLRQAIGWICDAADAAYIEDSDNKRIHEIFNIAAQAAGLGRRLPDEYERFDETIID